MLKIMNSCKRHRSVTLLLQDICFCKGNAAFSAEGPVPRRRAAMLWAKQELPSCSAACHARAQQALRELSLLQREGLLILQRSQWSLSTADSCENNSHSLAFALITCLKLGNSEGWGISFFLMHRVAQNWEGFPLTFPYAHIAMAHGGSERRNM